MPPFDEALLMGAAAQDNSFLGHMQLVELRLLRLKVDSQAIRPNGPCSGLLDWRLRPKWQRRHHWMKRINGCGSWAII
jgi:hypothetical protein